MHKSKFSPLIYTALGAIIVLAVIGTKELVINDLLLLNKEEELGISIAPTPINENIPAATAEYNQSPQPTTNTYLNKRVNEIDNRIQELEAQKVKAKEVRDSTISQLTSSSQPEGYNPMNTMLLIKQTDNNYQKKVDELQKEITALNAEKTQIMLN